MSGERSSSGSCGNERLVGRADRSTWTGRRDYALLVVVLQTGLRASEIVNLRRGDIVTGAGAHVRCEGKGRKQRCTPLRQDTLKVLNVWLRERKGRIDDPLFPTVRGAKLSRDALERLVHKHALSASKSCPSLMEKRVSPHVLRHSTAMELLHHGVDQSVIALWLGHESVETTQVYIHADLRLKERCWRESSHRTRVPGDTIRATSCLRSSNRFDYAELPRRNARDSPISPHPTRHNPARGIMALCRYRHKAHFSEVRTGWDYTKNGYALGELVAEIASCYVSAELGIPQGEGLGNHAAYLKSWLEALKNDQELRLQGGEAGIESDRLPVGVREEGGTRGGRSDGTGMVNKPGSS